MLKELIHEAVKNQEKKRYKGIHASALGGCPRTHYWKIKGIKETTPPNLGALMNFKMGNVWEDTLLGLIAELPEVEIIKEDYKQIWHVPELNLYGETDIPLKIADKRVIIDVKTVNSAWFGYKEKEYSKVADKMTKNEFLLRENPEYEIQQGCYLLMAKLLGKKYDEARLIFVNKDNSYIGWEVVITLTPELEKKIMERINYLNKCLKNHELPRCECTSWKVGYCNFGVVETRTTNSKKKEINSECCQVEYVLSKQEVKNG